MSEKTQSITIIDVANSIEKRVKELQSNGEIHLPANYSAVNALKSACLIIQELEDKDHRPALVVCTKESVTNALFDMVIQGLSPVKKQAYFIVRGVKLCMFRSYHGTIAVTKRIKNVDDVVALPVYQDDVFNYAIVRGAKKITEHKQESKNIDIKKLVGAYCTIYKKDGTEHSEYMTMEEIRVCWKKTSMSNPTVQLEFPQEMARRTVVNRTCKRFINTSDDSDLLIEAFNRTVSADSNVEDEIAEEIKSNANQGDVIDIKDYSTVEENKNNAKNAPPKAETGTSKDILTILSCARGKAESGEILLQLRADDGNVFYALTDFEYFTNTPIIITSSVTIEPPNALGRKIISLKKNVAQNVAEGSPTGEGGYAFPL